MNEKATLGLKLQSERMILARAKSIEGLGLRIKALRSQANAIKMKIDKIDNENDDYVSVSALEISRYLFYFLVILAAVLLDGLLLGNLARYIASLFVTEPIIIRIAAAILPIVIIIIEVLLSVKIAERLYETGARDGQYWAYVAIGLLFAALVPIASISLALRASVVYNEDVPVAAIAAIGVLSMIAHVALLFSGQLAMQAKGWLVYIFQKSGPQATLEERTKAHDAVWQKFSNAVIEYSHLLKSHIDSYGPFPPGPFSEDVWQLLAEFGLYPHSGKPNVPMHT